jgi:hypothetical protein
MRSEIEWRIVSCSWAEPYSGARTGFEHVRTGDLGLGGLSYVIVRRGGPYDA